MEPFSANSKKLKIGCQVAVYTHTSRTFEHTCDNALPHNYRLFSDYPKELNDMGMIQSGKHCNLKGNMYGT